MHFIRSKSGTKLGTLTTVNIKVSYVGTVAISTSLKECFSVEKIFSKIFKIK